MLKEELMSIHAMLSKLQERTTNETDASVLRLCRSNLEAAAEQAEAMENNLSVVNMYWNADEVEISFPCPKMHLTAKGIRMSSVFPSRALQEVL